MNTTNKPVFSSKIKHDRMPRFETLEPRKFLSTSGTMLQVSTANNLSSGSGARLTFSDHFTSQTATFPL